MIIYDRVATEPEMTIANYFTSTEYMAIDHFGQRLRDEVDLDLMGEELIWVVRDIFHPASVRLWLRREST
jgi:hypothetical protein